MKPVGTLNSRNVLAIIVLYQVRLQPKALFCFSEWPQISHNTQQTRLPSTEPWGLNVNFTTVRQFFSTHPPFKHATRKQNSTGI